MLAWAAKCTLARLCAWQSIPGRHAFGAARGRLALGLLLAILPGPAEVTAQSPPEKVPEIRFRRGDALRVGVWGRVELSGEFTVMTDGRIDHPLFQNLAIEGRTYEEVREDVIAFVGRFVKDPDVVVVPLQRISVGGAIMSPGIVSVDPRSTLLELLGQVGGPRSDAKVKYARIVRTNEKIKIPLWESPASGRTLLELGIHSGDQVMFPETRSFLSVIGQFMGVANTVLTITNFIYLVTRR